MVSASLDGRVLSNLLMTTQKNLHCVEDVGLNVAVLTVEVCPDVFITLIMNLVLSTEKRHVQ